jgi:hypothetical protein
MEGGPVEPEGDRSEQKYRSVMGNFQGFPDFHHDGQVITLWTLAATTAELSFIPWLCQDWLGDLKANARMHSRSWHQQRQAIATAERDAQAALIRDLLGPGPFRRVAVAPSVLTWNGGTVPHLAEAAYQERAMPAGTLEPFRLAVLGDALEEAGCADEDLLGHLRATDVVHVRGCWAVDAILAKE